MIRFLNILTLVVFLTSCNYSINKDDENIDEDNNSDMAYSSDYLFDEWLNNFNIKRGNIIDSSGKRAFELWAYFDHLAKDDSLLIWYPSKDSSYWLITNYDKINNTRIEKDYPHIDLRFLDVKHRKVYLGLLLLDSLQQRNIEHYWYDSNTFYYFEESDKNKYRKLTKLRMEVDSIWTYHVEHKQ